MRIPDRVAAWLCIGALGLGLGARAEDDMSDWRFPSYAEPSRDVELDEDESPCGRASAPTERRQLVGDIFEYSYRVRVGYGVHDTLTLHRVVREVAPGVPVRAARGAFLVHGDAWGFRGAFLASGASGAVPRQQSLAVFLARRGVDVWGIDLRWVNVPKETSDFSFMKGWNLGLHARDVGTGLWLARGMRACSGSGNGRMVLLGWSRGATVSYAYLNAETRLAPEKRQVSGFIPVDSAYTLAPEAEEQRQGACQRYAALAQRQAAGQYEGGAVGSTLQGIGMLALAQPEALSAVPGFSNRQFALMVGAATHVLTTPPPVPAYHFTGGQVGADSSITGLAWTRERFFLDFLLQASPYQSLGEQVDSEALWCGAADVPYDDHLREVKVPVLYVGGGGGFGRFGVHTLSQLGSTDVSVHVVQRLPEAHRALEYGHADVFLADDAETAVWTPILDWMQRH